MGHYGCQNVSKFCCQSSLKAAMSHIKWSVVGDVPRRLCSVTASVVCTWFCSVGTINCGIYIRMKSDVSGSIF